MIVHEDNYSNGWGAQLSSYIAENEIYLLDAPDPTCSGLRCAGPVRADPGEVCHPIRRSHHRRGAFADESVMYPSQTKGSK